MHEKLSIAICKMSDTVLDKVIAIHSICLPYEVCNEINSFCFYDKYQSNIKKIKNVLHRKIKYSFHGFQGGHWWFEAAWYEDDEYQTHETQLQATNCIECGNYTNGNNFAVAADRCICTCNAIIHVNAEEEQEGLYWIGTESEVDPIESAFNDYRYYEYN